MNKNDFAFGKLNYLICALSVIIIVSGFFLMLGPSTTETAFEPDIFSTRRIVVAPMTCFFGFLLMIVGILYPKELVVNEETEQTELR